MSNRRASFLMDSSTELASEVSPPIHPVTDGPASWTTSQGDYGDGALGILEDDGDLQDSDDPDTTDNFDQEQDEIQDLYHVGNMPVAVTEAIRGVRGSSKVADHHLNPICLLLFRMMKTTILKLR